MRIRGILTFLAFSAPVAFAAAPALAYTPVRAAPVAQQDSPAMSSGGLVDTALMLGLGALGIQNQFKALAAQCVPSAADERFVQKMVLEVAKTGITSKEFGEATGIVQCASGNSFQNNELQRIAGAGNLKKCFEIVAEDSTGTLNGISLGSKDTKTLDQIVLQGFPKVSNTKVAKPGETDQVNVSNIHEIFSAVMRFFTPNDLLASEVSAATRLEQMNTNCSETKIAAAQRQAWMQFAQGAVTSIGSGTAQGDRAAALQAAAGMADPNSGIGTLLQIGGGILMK